ncbi:MAG: YjbQ family protein [Theionarchaea archaeon]|nr:YjbQ family protein [Theionarchaea archaeon]
MHTGEFDLRTSAKTEMVNITSLVSSVVEGSGISEGLCLVYIPHTTASVIVNEGWDPAVMEDISGYLDEKIPWRAGYKHSEGNSAAHIKSSILGHSASLVVKRGKLSLGTWQAVFFCEFDGPRSRKVQVDVIEG